MTFEEIRAAIVGRMAAFTGVAQSSIDYPNAPGQFTPPAAGLWCRLSILHGPSFMAGMADQPYTRKPGRIVVQCFAREGTGTKALTKLADDLEAHFAYWEQGNLECLEASQVNVGAGDTAGRPEGTGFYQINVNVRFLAG
ncbi:phage tail terminator-like protein [Parapusillimonas sp. JC17]|uniref:phage tail terminator-like protein n=1 Tax=Parapusillimonas sp. JC17 TaxID=3445768 RepID=UPI003FA012DC